MIRIFTLLYALFITGIVVCASNRWYPEVFVWVQTGASDKVMHFVLVGTMAFLLNLSLHAAPVWPSVGWLMEGTTIMLAIATVEEFSQTLFVHRTFDLLDLTCNYLGIMFLGSLALFFRPAREVSRAA